MTREETRQMMSIMEAYAEGNEIEVLNTKTKEWEYVKNPKFNKAPNMYRVRQKPIIDLLIT